jgi:hypothetical protein
MSETPDNPVPKPESPPSQEDVAALVEEWRKNRPDLSWKPKLSHHLQPGPKFIKWQTRLVYVFIGAFALLVVGLWSTPEQSRDVRGEIWSVTRPASGEYSWVVVALPDAPLQTLKYYGKKRLERGQSVVLEEVTGPLTGWKGYSFKGDQ